MCSAERSYRDTRRWGKPDDSQLILSKVQLTFETFNYRKLVGRSLGDEMAGVVGELGHESL